MSITYDEFLSMTDGHTIVDFWAEWCGPCKTFSPVFEEASMQFPDINFIKINIDENQELCRSIGIMSIPTIHYYIDNMEVAELIGGVNKEQFFKFIDDNKD